MQTRSLSSMKSKTSTHSMRALLALVFCLVWIFDAEVSVAVQNSGESHTENSTRTREELKAWRSSLEFGRRLVKDRAADELVGWGFSGLPKAVMGSVDNFLIAVIKKEVHPQKRYPVNVKEDINLQIHVFAATDKTQHDLVEYHWTYNSKPLRFVVGRNGMKIDFDLEQISTCQVTHGAACVDEAKRWVKEVLKLEGKYPALGHSIPYQVQFPWPDELSDGVSFSSAPEQDLTLLYGIPRLFDRVDAFVENGVLSVLIYKKIGQLMGYQDGSKWFKDEFRTIVHEKAREQGKLPAPEGE